jgi:hypothetical protein
MNKFGSHWEVTFVEIFVKLIFERSALEPCKATPSNKHFVSVIKTSKLIRCREIIVVCVGKKPPQ